ncbi:reverse transcriptase family protein [Scytonema millei]|uniref:RNA-directed DNA polymerase n=1 Tax=Scytonema millei VB511283 TaxID=1245923 RepID=A0A9X5E152_9CYAN|nr:reverse transcriptase family protein [Scytonema millei]NHC33428.1 RNA-directed DNA polymerase [Scytonema millei VB511283]
MVVKHQATIPRLIEGSIEQLRKKGFPECNTDEEIAMAMRISVEKLRFLAGDRNLSSNSLYSRFQIFKKTGEARTISAPTPELKAAQRWILKQILEKIEIHDAAHGFCRDRSIVTNASPHVGKDVIVKLDLQNFFQSILYKRVKELFCSFGYSETAATIFSLICTVTKIDINGKNSCNDIEKRHLPQGSPTSPAISNLVCDRLDTHLTKLAHNFGFCYTRYADDLTFSSFEKTSRQVNNLIHGSKLIITEEGFTVNPDKIKVLSKSVQQEITGIIVNQQLNLSRKTLKAFRATLYQIEQEGLSGKKWGNSNNLIAAITGFANYVAMVNPSKGAEFLASVERIKQKCDRS